MILQFSVDILLVEEYKNESWTLNEWVIEYERELVFACAVSTLKDLVFYPDTVLTDVDWEC